MQTQPPVKTQILGLLSQHRCLTGTELGRTLGISRAAVHKHIDALRASGLPVRGLSGRGYRLEEGITPIDGCAIRQALDENARRCVRRIVVEHSVDSTNDVIAGLGGPEALHGTVCLAEAQRQGRGRRGRRWIASPYRNLMMSIGWAYESWPRGVTGLSVAAGVALVAGLRKMGAEGLGTKWPNDIVCSGGKVGGILIDMAGEVGGPCTVVIGVGINVHIVASDGRRIDQSWADLNDLLGYCPDRNQLAAACLSPLCDLLGGLPDTGFEPWRRRWADVDVLKGSAVSVIERDDGRAICGRALGLDHDGALIVALAGGGKRRVVSGDVSVRAL